VLEEMIDALLNEDKTTLEVRRRMSIEQVVEKDLLPLMKVCNDDEIFGKIVRLMANLTLPLDMCIYTPYMNDTYANEVNNLISTTKNQCTDLDFLKALSANMKDILKKETLEPADCQCLNHCLLLLRNLVHIKPGASNTHQASLVHQCLISSFFINELDKVIYTMLNHKHKEVWTIAMAQLISFIFKEYSTSLLEPDIDDNSSAGSSEENQDLLELVCPSSTSGRTSDKNLSTNFKSKLQIQSSASENSSQASDDDDFMLEFKSTPDGKLEIKLTSCSQKPSEAQAMQNEAEALQRESQVTQSDEMDVGDGTLKNSPDSSSKIFSKNFKGSNSSINSDVGYHEGESNTKNMYSNTREENEAMSLINPSSCLMDTDILISYLKKFATEIMYSGFVDLVENILKALLTKYDNILDHSFLMWTVGFFLSFAHQQGLDFSHFKDVLNLDLFGFLVYEGIKCCEALAVKHRQKQDCSVEKHRMHLVVCTLNQLFRTLLANSKMDYLQNLQKCLSHMTDLHNLFVLLIGRYISEEQNVVYLRDLVQTNHVFILIIEEWLAQGYIGEHSGFSMLSHIKQYATKKIMSKYGMLLEHSDLNKDTLNVAVLTMMYHVAGDCRRQDALMQLPILKAFSEIWVDNAVRDHEEFKDLIEFVLEVFMNDAEQNPNLCAENLLDTQHYQQQVAVRGENKRGHSSSGGSGSGDAESSMNISSSSSFEEFSDDEQILMFTWMSELEGSSNIVEVVTKRLRDHGYSKSASQVSKYLSDNGFLDVSSSSISNSQVSSTTGGKLQDIGDFHENKSIMLELSSLPEDHLIPFLLDKLQALGFEPHLKWLQKQLLEAAYVKLGIKDPTYRINVEEPVAKFYALQNKPIPIVPWNEELESALSNPYFHLLQQTLGLYTCDDPNVIYPRIPPYLTPTLLVNKARQIGPIEALLVKFDVNTLKDSSELDIEQETPRHHRIEPYRPVKTLDHMWLNLIQKMKGELEIS
ncbi:protein timeless isoform X1, partial [Biomphalaria glabrata]